MRAFLPARVSKNAAAATGVDTMEAFSDMISRSISDPSAAVSPSGSDNVPRTSQNSRALMEYYGLRATRQRLGLAKLLFGRGHRHVTADALSAEASAAKMPASLATVYNVLNLFADVGLVRALPIEGTRTIFDTNTTDHAHFYYEGTSKVEDIPAVCAIPVTSIDPPEGYEVVRVDVVVRLRRKTAPVASGPAALS
jgi:Fur family iron response transcriptional regulator